MKTKMTPISLAAVAAVSKPNPVESRMALVQPADAARWLANSLWSKQRPYRDWHGEELAQAMRNKEFIQGTQIHFVKLNGVVHLVNGQHTLNAIVKYGQAVNLSVLTTTVTKESDIADIYSREDQHLQRTLSDTYGAHSLREKYSLSRSQINYIGSGLKAIIDEFGSVCHSRSYEARSADARMRLFDQYGEAGKAYFACINGAPTAASKELRVAAVIGVALKTFKDSPTKAQEFWSQVAFSDGLGLGDPRKTLMNWLMANPTRRTNPAARARVVARAWNMFLAGGSSQRFMTPDWTKPIVINVA